MASTISTAMPTADHAIEIVLPSRRESDTRGRLRRIIRLVRDVMGEIVLGTFPIAGYPEPANGYPESGTETGNV